METPCQSVNSCFVIYHVILAIFITPFFGLVWLNSTSWITKEICNGFSHWPRLDWGSGTKFSECFIEIHAFSFKEMHLKMSEGCCALKDIRPKPILTHWGRDKMDAISQTTFLSAFSWMKIFEFRLKFHWGLFLRVQLAKFQHWFR